MVLHRTADRKRRLPATLVVPLILYSARHEESLRNASDTPQVPKIRGAAGYLNRC